MSKVFSAPAFQAGLGLAGRGVPDISGNAAPQTGYQIFVGGPSPLTFGGTSAVAPLWAGLTALLVAALGHAVGDLNAQLYPLIGTAALRDITQGNNGGFAAKPGWDGATGCGTPVGQALLTQLGGSPPTPNPVGLWTINGNGFPGVLSIPSIDPHGTLGAGATVYGQHIFGFWDDPAQKLTFMRVSAPTDPTTFQVFTGYLMRPQPGSGQQETLAGSFEAFQGTGAGAQRSVFGWYAQPRIA